MSNLKMSLRKLIEGASTSEGMLTAVAEEETQANGLSVIVFDDGTKAYLTSIQNGVKEGNVRIDDEDDTILYYNKSEHWTQQKQGADGNEFTLRTFNGASKRPKNQLITRPVVSAV